MIVGLDEVGRGPLAGNVVAAAVVLDPKRPIPGLADSKKLSERKREILAEAIKSKAIAWAVGSCTPMEITKINILQASLLAMQRAFYALDIHTSIKLALIDGIYCPVLPCKVNAVIKGDDTVPAISAASIIAKVTRDDEMRELHKKFPQYGFAQNKGYSTDLHLKALKQFGATEYHRASFAPIKKLSIVTIT